MNDIYNPTVQTLLEKTGKPAPVMTNGLAILGDGRMEDGLIALWKNGQMNGVVKGVTGTTIFFTLGIGLFSLVRNKLEEKRTKQAIEAACKLSVVDECTTEVDSDEAHT